MRRLFVIVLFTLFASITLAQPGRWKGSQGWGMGSEYNRMYDPKTVETITGEVAKVEEITPAKGMSSGIHLLVKMTSSETISVHLGPKWFLENQDTRIQENDQVVIKGSRVTFAGKPAVIAAEVKKGDELLRLRDENGYPVWAGWRRR
jgi:hypothetical protein